MTDEEKQQIGLAIQEMTQTKGWKWLEDDLNKEILDEMELLSDCPIEETVEHQKVIQANKAVLNKVNEWLEWKKGTEAKK